MEEIQSVSYYHGYAINVIIVPNTLSANNTLVKKHPNQLDKMILKSSCFTRTTEHCGPKYGHWRHRQKKTYRNEHEVVHTTWQVIAFTKAMWNKTPK